MVLQFFLFVPNWFNAKDIAPVQSVVRRQKNMENFMANQTKITPDIAH
jgi:hypothetical protein